MIRTNLVVGILTATMGLAVISAAVPANAGSVSINVTPKGKDAKLLRHGLNLYSLARNHRSRNRARVDQRGTGNGAGVSQSGEGNVAGVFQRGRGHSATISQNGNNNTYGIFQFGRNTSTMATQTGDGKVGLVFQGGW